MSRINTNVSSMVAQHNLQRANANLSTRLERLSTGLKINRGSDGPAALIISERLSSEIQGIQAAIGNAERATNVVSTAEAALAEVGNLLISIKSLIVQSANEGGMSDEEIAANQLQVDDAIRSITRIADTTSFAGLKLLNGSMDYITASVAASTISDIDIHAANFGTSSTLPVSVQVVDSAERASLYLSTTIGSQLASTHTLEIAGNKGVEVISFIGSGGITTSLSNVAAAVNAVSDSTGVTAFVTSGQGGVSSALVFRTTDYGTDAFVSVKRIDSNVNANPDVFETFTGVGGTETQRDTGMDVLALINGTLALGDGISCKLNSSSLDVDITLTVGQATSLTTTNFSITGGGALFQLGREVESSQQISLGFGSVSASNLGNSTVGYLSSVTSGGAASLISGETSDASAIIESSISQVSTMRGRLGAFEKNTLQTNIRSLQIALENVTASQSQIRDADFAAETSELTRAQLLVNVGTTVLATTNAQAGSILTLLG